MAGQLSTTTTGAIRSGIDTRSPEFARNAAHNTALGETLRRRTAQVVAGGRDREIARHRERGKLLPRERIDLIVDPGTAFLELSTLAAWGQHDDRSAGAGVVTGIGLLHGHPAMFIANDATAKGGTLFPETVRKHIRAQEIALENRLPCIYLVDSGGAYLPLQDQVFPDYDHFGHSFYLQTRMSAAGLPQIAVVLGGCTAGGAYIPALSDEVIMVRGTGRIFLGGPAIVKAALNEIVDPETLGGAEVHTLRSGVSDHMVDDEEQAYRLVRRIFASMRRTDLPTASSLEPRPPLYSPAELVGVLPADLKHVYDVREVIARIVDGSELQEFKPQYATTVVCGFARIHGHEIGIVANNGVLFSDSSLKATHFIEMCNQRGQALLFLQNTTGYMVGRAAEAAGIAKDGAKMVAAVANSTVPKLTILIGGSYGAGNYGMCGRGFRPHFLFAWPNSRIATMSAETAQTVLVDVRAGGLSAESQTAEGVAALRAEVALQYETQSDPYYATSRLWDDGLIEPEDTRDVLGLCLSLAARNPAQPGRFRVFRM